MTKTYKNQKTIYRFKNPFKRRKPGFELRTQTNTTTPRELTPEDLEENQDRARRRAKAKVRDLLMSNDFDKFGTLTFDPKRHPAHDYDYCHAKVSKFIKNQARIHGLFRYVIVSEPMKDGKWHFHFVFGDFKGKYTPTRVRGTGKLARQCYKIDAWEKNYGFADMEDIADTSRLANYISKYITKDFDIKAKGKKRYWSSNGLKMPSIDYDPELKDILKTVDINGTSYSYENAHVEIVTYPLLVHEPKSHKTPKN